MSPFRSGLLRSDRSDEREYRPDKVKTGGDAGFPGRGMFNARPPRPFAAPAQAAGLPCCGVKTMLSVNSPSSAVMERKPLYFSTTMRMLFMPKPW